MTNLNQLRIEHSMTVKDRQRCSTENWSETFLDYAQVIAELCEKLEHIKIGKRVWQVKRCGSTLSNDQEVTLVNLDFAEWKDIELFTIDESRTVGGLITHIRVLEVHNIPAAILRAYCLIMLLLAYY